MALFIYQPGIQPIGQFDLLDSYALYVTGGQVGTVFPAVRHNTATEKAASDVFDGYENYTTLMRLAVAPCINSYCTRPLFLLDEGTAGYGTLFGQVIGYPVGLTTIGANFGPPTYAGSGKVTCWDKPGIYAISVDAVDTGSDGLVPTNVAVTVGCELTCLKYGRITVYGTSNPTVTYANVGNFLEFECSPFLVTTPPSLVGATEAATRIVIQFNPCCCTNYYR